MALPIQYTFWSSTTGDVLFNNAALLAVLNGTPGTVTFADETVTTLHLDTGTKTATAVAGAATLNKTSGKITSEALTTAGLADYTLTLTNSKIAAGDIILCSVANGTNTQGTLAMGPQVCGAGSATIIVHNLNASVALNGTVVISYAILKA